MTKPILDKTNNSTKLAYYTEKIFLIIGGGVADITPDKYKKIMSLLEDVFKAQQAQLEQQVRESERERIKNIELFNLSSKIEKSIKKVTGYNQIFEKENKKELAQNIRNLLAYIGGMKSTLSQPKENKE